LSLVDSYEFKEELELEKRLAYSMEEVSVFLSSIKKPDWHSLRDGRITVAQKLARGMEFFKLYRDLQKQRLEIFGITESCFSPKLIVSSKLYNTLMKCAFLEGDIYGISADYLNSIDLSGNARESILVPANFKSGHELYPIYRFNEEVLGDVRSISNGGDNESASEIISLAGLILLKFKESYDETDRVESWAIRQPAQIEKGMFANPDLAIKSLQSALSLKLISLNYAMPAGNDIGDYTNGEYVEWMLEDECDLTCLDVSKSELLEKALFTLSLAHTFEGHAITEKIGFEERYMLRVINGKERDINVRFGNISIATQESLVNAADNLYGIHLIEAEKRSPLAHLAYGRFHGDTRLENFLLCPSLPFCKLSDFKSYLGNRAEDIAILFTDPIINPVVSDKSQKISYLSRFLEDYDNLSKTYRFYGDKTWIYDSIAGCNSFTDLAEILLPNLLAMELLVSSMYVVSYIARDDFVTARYYLDVSENNLLLKQGDKAALVYMREFTSALRESGHYEFLRSS
jgi:hypothetical protein